MSHECEYNAQKPSDPKPFDDLSATRGTSVCPGPCDDVVVPWRRVLQRQQLMCRLIIHILPIYYPCIIHVLSKDYPYIIHRSIYHHNQNELSLNPFERSPSDAAVQRISLTPRKDGQRVA